VGNGRLPSVTSARRFRVLRDAPRALDGRAAEDLRFIRRTMEDSSTFTAVPGAGGMAMGGVGCAAAAVAAMQTTPAAWLVAWLTGAAVAILVGAVGLARKSRAAGRPALHPIASKFVRSLMPPLVAGAVLTAVMWRAGLRDALPGTWLLLYGTGLLTAGALSIAVVPILGGCFVALAAAAFLTPAAWGDLWMAAGFGGLHLAFGFVIWRRHGG
jgi:hypothetical protein